MRALPCFGSGTRCRITGGSEIERAGRVQRVAVGADHTLRLCVNRPTPPAKPIVDAKYMSDSAGRNRVVWALLFTACYSRHQFVWLTFRQTTEAVIEGCEAAWAFFGGVFRTVIPDNMGSIVDGADSIDPRLNQAFIEYAQARGFHIDPARVRHPKDKPRVERAVPFARNSFFAGEHFIDLADAQRRAIEWCRVRADLRVHGTTQARPAEVFTSQEQPRRLPAPTEAYDLSPLLSGDQRARPSGPFSARTTPHPSRWTR